MVALVESTVAAVMPMPGTQTTAFASYLALTGECCHPAPSLRDSVKTSNS